MLGSKHLINNSYIFDFGFGRQVIEFLYKKKPHRNGWFLVNARLSRKWERFEVFARAQNLFNVEYEEIEGIPSAGRCVEAGIRVQW